MALQVVGHYPEEIFPRVLRNARCRESLAMTDEAIGGTGALSMTFNNFESKKILKLTNHLPMHTLQF